MSIKQSVTSDAIVCLECGNSLKMSKKHIASALGLSVDGCRAKWSLATHYPMGAPWYARHRSEMALKMELGRKRPAEAKAVSEEVKAVEKRPRHRYPPLRWSKSAG
jgi:predicted transcriptional regulator